MTAAVDHTRDHDLTVAGQQGACGWALHLLATEPHRITGEPLPLLSWAIRDEQPRLAGLVRADTDRRREAIVRAWAEHLGVLATYAASEDGEQRTECDGVAHGVEVHVHAWLKGRTT